MFQKIFFTSDNNNKIKLASIFVLFAIYRRQWRSTIKNLRYNKKRIIDGKKLQNTLKYIYRTSRKNSDIT